jgi:hypothetical protein
MNTKLKKSEKNQSDIAIELSKWKNSCQPRASVYPFSPNSEIRLTKREYFAGLAMQGLCSDQNTNYVDIGKRSVKIADLLLQELSKGVVDN